MRWDEQVCHLRDGTIAALRQTARKCGTSAEAMANIERFVFEEFEAIRRLSPRPDIDEVAEDVPRRIFERIERETKALSIGAGDGASLSVPIGHHSATITIR